MKLITLYVGERLDHVVQFDGVCPETETYIIEKQDYTQLFAFYHTLGQTPTSRKKGMEDINGSIILQTDEQETRAYIKEIKAVRRNNPDSDTELDIEVSLSLIKPEQMNLDTLEENCLSFYSDRPNLWPLVLQAGNIEKPLLVNVNIVLDAGRKYERKVILCVAPQNCIYDVVLDFGSEASQMGVFRRDLLQTDRKIHKLFDEMKEILRQEGQTVADANHEEPNAPNNVKDADFVQYDDDRHLFKSVFFVRATPPMEDLCNSLKMLTTNTEAKTLKDEGYIQVPNLKITQFGGVTLPELGGAGDNNVDTYATIYRKSLNKFVLNAIRKRTENECVNLYVLMPNVYSPVDVVEHLQQLRKDIQTIIRENNLNVKAIELSSLSESDASMLGAFEVINKYGNTKNRDPDDGAYIIIDAGKGTLDFSVLRFEWTDNGLKTHSLFRNGIIGAGNSLTYAYLYGLIYDYFSSLDVDDLNDRKIREFIFHNVLGSTPKGIEKGGGDLASLLSLMKAVENYKMSVGLSQPSNKIDPLKSNRAKQKDHLQVQMEALVQFITNMVDGNSYKPLSVKANSYVTETIKQIVSKVCDGTKGLGRLKMVKNYKPANGVIFAGRAFCLQEFKEAMKKKLVEEDIIQPNELVYISEDNEWAISQKNVCLYVRSAILAGKYNSRMSSMPWVEHNTKTDDGQQEDNKLIQRISRFFNPIAKIFEKKGNKKRKFFSEANGLVNFRESIEQIPGNVDDNWLVTGCQLSIGRNDELVVGSTKYGGRHLRGDVKVFFTGSKFMYRYCSNTGEYRTEDLTNNGLNLDTSFFYFGTQFPNVQPANIDNVILPYNPKATLTPHSDGPQKPDRKEEGTPKSAKGGVSPLDQLTELAKKLAK